MSAADFFTGAVLGAAVGSVLSRPAARPGAAGYDFFPISLSMADSQDQPKKYRVFTVGENEPLMWRCAWCDDDDGIKVLGRVNHGTCIFHRVKNLTSCMPKDHVEVIYAALLAKCAGQTWGADFWRDA